MRRYILHAAMRLAEYIVVGVNGGKPVCRIEIGRGMDKRGVAGIGLASEPLFLLQDFQRIGGGEGLALKQACCRAANRHIALFKRLPEVAVAAHKRTQRGAKRRNAGLQALEQQRSHKPRNPISGAEQIAKFGLVRGFGLNEVGCPIARRRMRAQQLL